VVALTIDDGWSSRDAVLAVLNDRDVRATFFLTGRALVGDYGFIARALAAGCEVGNHTMDHYDLTNKSKAYIQKDLQDFEDLVSAVVSSATTKPYMRPSGGSLNQTVNDAAAEAGYRPILWSVSAGDGSASTTTDQMVRNVLTGSRPGAIILMHFGPRAVVALPGIIDGLRGRKLEPVTLTALFAGSG
jgi:peptidoglycan/xylan/chitin deacetylase (PgdA/CDA1 family)